MKVKFKINKMKGSTLYEKFHSERKLQKRILTEDNFTYHYLMYELKTRLKGVKNVLDIGCGTGAIDFYLAKRGISVIGLDISTNAVENARQNAINFGLANKTKFFVSDFLESNVKKQFDLVICSEVLEHLPNDLKASQKIVKLLTTKGIVIFSSPSVNSLMYKFGLAKKHDIQAGHLRRYDVKSFSKLIKNAGFRIIKIEKTQGFLRDALFLFPLGELIVKVANRFSFISNLLTILDGLSLPFGESDILIVARKK